MSGVLEEIVQRVNEEDSTNSMTNHDGHDSGTTGTRVFNTRYRIIGKLEEIQDLLTEATSKQELTASEYDKLNSLLGRVIGMVFDTMSVSEQSDPLSHY
jgi:hypothetical protein